MISNSDFVHLHVHSEYSEFDGQAKLPSLVMQARKMGFRALALSDHGTIGGIIKFIAECKRKKDKNDNPIPYPTLKPIIACEFYLARNHKWHGMNAAKLQDPNYDGPDLQPEGGKGNRHIILGAVNWEGYKNICRLSEASWVDGFYSRPRIDIELMEKYSKGVFCQTACMSSFINASLLHDKYDNAKKGVGILKDIYGERLFLEAQYHGLSSEAAIIPDIFKLGNETNTPIVATNDVHYIEKRHAKSQEVLMAMSMKKCILSPNRFHFPYDEFYLKSADEMAKVFSGKPEVIYNTVALAEMINDKDIESHMGGMRLPKFDLPEQFKTPYEYLEHLAWEGMKKLNWIDSPSHVAALKKELNDVQIAKKNNNYDFATYFLIVWDYINFAKKKGILTGSGRGSGYASVLLRVLGITYGPDPLKYGLLWERFLGFDDKVFIKEEDFGYDDEEDGPVSSILDKIDVIDNMKEDQEQEIEIPEASFAEEEA